MKPTNALLRFTVENFRSIAQRKTIKFTPDSIKDEPQNNVIVSDKVRYLSTVAIYGANSSGKSNLVDAIAYMMSIVLGSVKVNDKDVLPYDPFLLNTDSGSKPTLYEVEAIVNGMRYRYGFSNLEDRICEEWLSQVINSKTEKILFIRNLEGIGVDPGLVPEGVDLESRTNDNRLFLSLVGQLGGKISNEIISFFNTSLNVLSGLDTKGYHLFSRLMLSKKLPGYQQMMAFFQQIQLGFSGLSVKTNDFDPSDIPLELPSELRDRLINELTGKKRIEILSSHRIYDKNGKAVGQSSFPFESMESEGTKKIFDLGGPVFDTIESGSVLVIDELDAKMHPLISQELVKLFNDPVRNNTGAQLIFTTHDTNLLSSGLLRRDQIWFTEKDSCEQTDVYSMRQIVLPDGSKPRGDGNLERNYIRGRYGAIPYIRSSFND